MASLRLPAQPRAARLVAPRPQARAVVAKASYVADPVAIAIKGADGSDKGSGQLSLKVADPKTARHVVHRYLVLVRQNARQGTASSKTRAMVSGGGRKPYQQKGSGKARQGSKTSPLLRGGGVVFGPKPKDWSISMNKKEKRLAMATALQSAACDITAVDSFKPIEAEPKTRNLVQLCKSVGVDPMQTYTLVITKEKNAMVYRAGRNIGRMQINDAHHLRVYDVLRADKIIVEAAALNVINKRFNGSDTKASKSGGGRSKRGKSAASEPSSALEPGGEEALKQLDEAAKKSGDGSVEPPPGDAQVEVETAEVAPSAAPEADSDDPKEATKA